MAASAAPARPRVGVVKMASCDGCQLTILDLEERLLDVTERFEILDFPEASSARSAGPFDVLFIEGSISDPHQAERIVELRARTRYLVTIGACATAGGIQALRNWGDHAAFRDAVYARPEWVASLDRSLPVAELVPVDAELRGCPIDPDQLLELLAALATGRRPQLRDESVCQECKRRGAVCVAVAKGVPCLGQVTQGGCGAICPRYGRGCYGCFGPREGANVDGLLRHLTADLGHAPVEAGRLLAGFTAWAQPFRSAIDATGGAPEGSRRSLPMAPEAARRAAQEGAR